MKPPLRADHSSPSAPGRAAAEMARVCDQLDLAGLIARMARGDESALSDFHRIMADRLFSMAFRLLNDREAAAEALQDCMIRVWHHAGRFDPRLGEAFTWTAMILRGLCIDQIRKRQRRHEGMNRWEKATGDNTLSPHGGMEDLFFRETISRVRRALAALDTSDRTCLETVLFSPASTADYAASLGLAPGTLKVRAHRAMQRLRKLLGAEPSA